MVHLSSSRVFVTLWCDNEAAVHIVENPIFHECTKHLVIDYHLVREKFKVDLFIPRHISSHSQFADIFTKPFSTAQFTRLVSKLDLIDFH